MKFRTRLINLRRIVGLRVVDHIAKFGTVGFEFGRRSAFGCKERCHTFQGMTDLINFQNILDGKMADECPPRRPYLENSVAGQIAHRFAYGSPSNLQGNGQFTLRKGRVRIHPTA